MKKRIFMLLLVFHICFLVSCGNPATASTMQLVKTEGAVNVSDGSGEEISLFENMRLYSGYSLFTAKGSYAWINLDSTKLAKMDVESEIEVQKKKKDLEIVVNSGKLYFNITERLSDDETLNIKSSTMSVGIHGTCGWVEVGDPEHMKVYILEGTVQCTAADADSGKSKTINVSGGEMAEMVLYPDGQKAYDISKSQFTEQDIADFVISEVAQDDKLCEKILEESGLGILELWEEIKPEATPTAPLSQEEGNPLATPSGEVTEDPVIDWKDANLEAAIREATGIYGRDIVTSDVIGLQSLNLLYSNIQDISALGELKNLTRLGLSGNEIKDISVLENLTNLTELTLAENQIVDISALENLTSLTSLDLNRNQIADISALGKLTSLRNLNIAENRLSGIGALQSLESLTELNLMGNQISDLDALNSLGNLTILYLNSNQIEDIRTLGSLTKLEVLSLEDNQISDLQALRNLRNLSRLILNDNQITDVRGLGNLTGLTELYLENNQITDVSALGNLRNLKNLSLVGNSVNDYSSVESVPNLFR